MSDFFIPTFYFVVVFPEIKNPSISNGFWILLIFAVFPDFRYKYMASDFFIPTFLIYETEWRSKYGSKLERTAVWLSPVNPDTMHVREKNLHLSLNSSLEP